MMDDAELRYCNCLKQPCVLKKALLITVTCRVYVYGNNPLLEVMFILKMYVANACYKLRGIIIGDSLAIA